MSEKNDNAFDVLNNWIRETESSVVNFLSVFAPWLAPLVPAFMTYQHAISPVINFPWYIALPAALVVEILGFSAVSTYLAFYFHNRKIERIVKAKKKRGQPVSTLQKSKRRAPIEVVVFAFAFYLALILTSNVLLDSFPSERWAVISVRALFTLQTIPAALIVAVRTQHRELLKQMSKETSGKVSGNLQGDSETSPKLSEKLPKDWRKLRPTLTERDVANLANMDTLQVKAVAVQYEVDEKTVYNWRRRARIELGMEVETGRNP